MQEAVICISFSKKIRAYLKKKILSVLLNARWLNSIGNPFLIIECRYLSVYKTICVPVWNANSLIFLSKNVKKARCRSPPFQFEFIKKIQIGDKENEKLQRK